ncbi:MAG: beta-ketoacyl synthase N-terminal-like domain-containing protein [Pyrodictiaceae archaeon]
MEKVYVLGAGLVKVDRHYDKGLHELALEATLAALEDKDVMPQALVVANAFSEVLQEQASLASHLASAMGLKGIPAFRVENGGASGGHALLQAYSLIRSGVYDVVLVVGVEKLTDYASAASVRAQSMILDSDYETPYGITTAGINAMMMRHYMNKYNVSRDEMSEWPVMMHDNASDNPYAQIRKRITKDAIPKSQVIAEPITILDSSPIGDGAAAVILASSRIVEKVRADYRVLVAGVGSATDFPSLHMRARFDVLEAARRASSQAYSMAGISPRDIDVVELHDVYTIDAILLLEDLGFSEKGRAARDLAEGRFRIGDKPTANPSGGLKARGHPIGATGVYQAAEVFLQLIGGFKGRRVDNAERGLVLSMGDVGESAVALVFTREA